jgi:hypothetical protein
MAQQQPRRNGLRWIGSLAAPGLGTPPVIEKLVVSTNGAALYCGDPLVEQTDGSVYPVTSGGTAFAFVMQSCTNYLGPDGIPRKGQYLPISTAYTGNQDFTNPYASRVLVIPLDTNHLFEIVVPTGAASYAAAEALVGQAVNLVINTGSNLTGYSGVTTDTVANFQATTVTGDVQLRRIPRYGVNGVANDPTQAYWTGIFSPLRIATLI